MWNLIVNIAELFWDLCEHLNYFLKLHSHILVLCVAVLYNFRNFSVLCIGAQNQNLENLYFSAFSSQTLSNSLLCLSFFIVIGRICNSLLNCFFRDFCGFRDFRVFDLLYGYWIVLNLKSCVFLHPSYFRWKHWTDLLSLLLLQMTFLLKNFLQYPVHHSLMFWTDIVYFQEFLWNLVLAHL